MKPPQGKAPLPQQSYSDVNSLADTNLIGPKQVDRAGKGDRILVELWQPITTLFPLLTPPPPQSLSHSPIGGYIMKPRILHLSDTIGVRKRPSCLTHSVSLPHKMSCSIQAYLHTQHYQQMFCIVKELPAQNILLIALQTRHFSDAAV